MLEYELPVPDPTPVQAIKLAHAMTALINGGYRFGPPPKAPEPWPNSRAYLFVVQKDLDEKGVAQLAGFICLHHDGETLSLFGLQSFIDVTSNALRAAGYRDKKVPKWAHEKEV